MEVIGRRWTITGAFGSGDTGLLLMMTRHRMGSSATDRFIVGTLITGLYRAVLLPAVRVYLSEQFPTASAGAGTFSASRSGGSSRRGPCPTCWKPIPGFARIFFSARWWWWWAALLSRCCSQGDLGNLETFTEALPELA